MFSTETRCVLLKRSGSIQESIMGQYKKKASNWERIQEERVRRYSSVSWVHTRKTLQVDPRILLGSVQVYFVATTFPRKTLGQTQAIFPCIMKTPEEGFAFASLHVLRMVLYT